MINFVLPNPFEFQISYDVAVVQWITPCHKNRTTTRVITLWRVYVTSLTTSVSTMRFLCEIKFILKAIKSRFKRSCDKQNLTLVVISYEIYEQTILISPFAILFICILCYYFIFSSLTFFLRGDLLYDVTNLQ